MGEGIPRVDELLEEGAQRPGEPLPFLEVVMEMSGSGGVAIGQQSSELPQGQPPAEEINRLSISQVGETSLRRRPLQAGPEPGIHLDFERLRHQAQHPAKVEPRLITVISKALLG